MFGANIGGMFGIFSEDDKYIIFNGYDDIVILV
jgi:hypothetical protein